MTVRITECIDSYNRQREAGEPLMTQARLADALGVTQSAVSFWVNDKRAMNVPMAIRVAEILSCSLNDLFDMPGDSQAVIATDSAVLDRGIG